MPDMNCLPLWIRREASQIGEALCEIRLRREKPVQFSLRNREDMLKGVISSEDFDAAVSALIGFSLYARENELSNGFFTLQDGSRAGISGNFMGDSCSIGSVSDIYSVCIRIAREIQGCADRIMEAVSLSKGTVIVSPPGLGKTTVLRETVRKLSESGNTISLMDERGEIAACIKGKPTLDVGPRTDVYTMCPKAEGMIRAIRAMAPDMIAADEIGAPEDGAALREAARMGVRFISTLHGDSLDPTKMRLCASELIKEGLIDTGILLGPERGEITEIKHYDGADL